MATLITATNGGGSSTPDTYLGYQAAAQSRNVIIDLISGTDVAVALVAPRMRSGTLQFLYSSKDAAFAALALHRQLSAFTLTDDDIPDIGMTYVLDGSGLTISLDPESMTVWVVSVQYQEISG